MIVTIKENIIFNEHLSNIDNGIDSIATKIDNENYILQSFLDSVNSVNDNISENADKIIQQLDSFDWSAVWIPTLTSIFVFLVCEFSRYLYTQNKRLNDLKSECNIFSQQIYSLSTNVNLFVTYIKRCADNMKTSVGVSPVKLEINSIHLDTLRQYGVEFLNTHFLTNRKGNNDYNKIWIKKEKQNTNKNIDAEIIKHIQNITWQLDNLTKLQMHSNSVYSEYYERCVKFMDKWNDSIMNIGLMIDILRNDPISYPVFNTFYKTVKIPDSANHTKVDRTAFVNNVFAPLIKHCYSNKELNANPNVKWQLINSLQNIDIIKGQLDTINTEAAKDLYGYADKIQTSYKSLTDSIMILNNNEFKCILKIK